MPIRQEIILVLLFLAFTAIGCDSESTRPSDTTRPAAVTNLAIEGVSGGVIAFSWIATGDDGKSGTASFYDLRSAADSSTLKNWGGALQQLGEPVPSSVGARETMELPDTFSVTTYFAVKVSDEAENTSPLSNIVVRKR